MVIVSFELNEIGIIPRVGIRPDNYKLKPNEIFIENNLVLETRSYLNEHLDELITILENEQQNQTSERFEDGESNS